MRSLHVIDLENVSWHEERRWDGAACRLDHHLDAHHREGDLVLIASNRRIWRDCAFEIPVPHRYLISTIERDSADLALLYAASCIDLSTIERLLIVSGDGIFAPFAAEAAAAGVHVTAVGVAGTMANRLRLSAHVTELLPPFPGEPSAPAAARITGEIQPFFADALKPALASSAATSFV